MLGASFKERDGGGKGKRRFQFPRGLDYFSFLLGKGDKEPLQVNVEATIGGKTLGFPSYGANPVGLETGVRDRAV